MNKSWHSEREHSWQKKDRLPLLGMKWKDQLYTDKTLPFGLRSSPKIFRECEDQMRGKVD